MSRFGKTVQFVAMSLAVFSAARLGIYLFHRETFSGLGPIRTVMAFIAGIRFDISILLTFFALPIVMFNLPGKIAGNRAWRNFWGWIPYPMLFGAAFLLAGDIAYFGEVRRHTTTELALMGNDMRFLFDMVISGYLWQTLALLGGLVLLFLGWKRVLNAPEGDEKPGWKRFLVTGVLLFILIRGSFGDKAINIIDAFSGGDTAYGNLVLNGVFTAYHSTRASRRVNHAFFKPTEARAILNLPDTDYPASRSYRHDGKTGYNIVVFLMESWGCKYVDSFGGNGYGVTPNFDSLAGHGLKFGNFYAAGQRSIVGIQATLTGIQPLDGMPAIGSGLEASRLSLLANIARQNGYGTIFVQSSRRRSFRVDAIASAVGFEQYYGMEDMPILLNYPDKGASKFGWDYETFMFLKGKLDAMQKPFFAYVFTGTTHTPYAPLGPEWEKRKHDANDENGFLNTLYYSDWSLGRFMEEAKNSPWFKNTVFIFTADHTQVHYGQAGYREMFHTPLVIYAPEIFKNPQTPGTVGSQLDIMPTVMDILGFDDEFSSLGESLFRKKGNWALTSEGEVSGIIADKGYLKHSLKNRMETKYFGPGEAPAGYFDSLERTLLASDQVTWELLRSNHWAK